jgi:cyclohexanone monooxygenase
MGMHTLDGDGRGESGSISEDLSAAARICRETDTPADIDLVALREKYRRERNKRIRGDGTRQYVELKDKFADYYEVDPYSPPVQRPPISCDSDVAVLGGGFAGLIAAARLKEAGVADIRVIEMAGDFGGTWYWNRFPGVQCDVESYTYLPFLEETNYMPTERYARGPEIHEHCRRIAKHFGLYDKAIFSTIVRALNWDEEIKRWRVSTNHGDTIRARFVIVASGPQNKPKLPGVPGIENFKGRSFHTARWDYEYTGGDTWGGLDKLSDKRVAIIGTGATAIQCVPYLGKYAQQLYVFQRTPSYVDVRGNRPTDLQWARSLKPGWQAVRQKSFHAAANEGLASPEEDLICDGWGELNRNISARLLEMGNPSLTPEQYLELRELEDFRAMERIRRRVDSVIENKITAEMLKAWYRFSCKRPCFNDDYLPTFNRPNVTLVDVSATKGVERITQTGLVSGATEYEVDCIIYASGFESTTDLRRRYGIGEIRGRDDLSLYDHWSDGFRTLHGLMTHGFPNQFYTGYTQVGVAAAINLMYDQQTSHIAYIIKETLARGACTAEPGQEAQDAWCKEIRDKAISKTEFLRGCTPGYYNNEGDVSEWSPHFGEPYDAGYSAFDRLLKSWRDKGDLEGIVLSA